MNSTASRAHHWLFGGAVAALCCTTIACGGVRLEDDDGGGGNDGATSGLPSGVTTSTGATSTGAGSGGSGATGSNSTVTGVGGAGQGGAGQGGAGQGGAGQGGASACSTECGPTEQCDGAQRGLDDDCDGQVDEGCSCTPGAASPCFKGDPSYVAEGDCFAGTMVCGDDGAWGACVGGHHAFGGDSCVDPVGCHAISAVPYQTADLSDGIGPFGDGAEDEKWSVDCPPGVSPCPEPLGASFQALQAGQYEVTYTRAVDGDEQSCTYPLHVGARGLRVELSWNYAAGADLDLHIQQPGTLVPLSAGGSGSTDCAWDNCRIDNGFPEWFPASAPVGDPVAWYLDPEQDLNGCYYAPHGYGLEWQGMGRGCHNPRLDVDNITCLPADTDPNSPNYCAPENVNIDFPPRDQWMRIGVVHYSGAEAQPVLKVFCDGALRATLGPQGFDAPVVLGGSGFDQLGWLATDVAFVEDGCGGSQCIISPVYQAGTTPLVGAVPLNGPAYPSLP